MKTKLLAAGLALGMSTSAWGLNIDTTGSGSIPGSIFFSTIGWDLNGNAVIADIRSSGSTTTDATLYMQNSFSFGGTGSPLLTYQLVLPLSATFNATLQRTTFVLTGANTGTFSLFLDTTPTLDVEAGTGYGNLNGGVLDAGQVEIATGNIAAIGASGFRITGDDTTVAPIDGFDGEVNGLSIDSIQMNGSTQFSIDITSKVDAFIVSALDALTVDLTLSNLSYNAPFPDGRASDAVVNYNAVFSDDSGDTVVPDLNTNLTCGPTTKATCDAQFQVGGNSTFFDPRVPEPATLGLTGLGLTLLGFAGRRRRKS
jgi:hypothetical protein